MVQKRRGRLSNSELASKAPQRKKSTISNRALTLASSLSKSREEAKRQRANRLLEKREIDKFINAADKHVPNVADWANMEQIERERLILKAAYATILRSACTTKREIESIVISVLKQIKNGDIFEDVTAIEETQMRICAFLLGDNGIPMTDTIGPRVFCESKALKRTFTKEWKADPEFTSYAALTVDAKLAWAFVMRLRQRMTDKLNRQVYALFKHEALAESSQYEAAIGKVMTKMIAEYSIESNHPSLPEPYILERKFAINVVVQVGLDSIVQDWASTYGRDLPTSTRGNVENGLIGMLSSRAEYKGCPSLHLHFANLYEKIKKIRNITGDGDFQGTFPYSQGLIEDPVEVSDNFEELEEVNDKRKDPKVVDLTEIEESSEEIPRQPTIPASQKRLWEKQFESDSEELIASLESPEPSMKEKSSKLEKPLLPYMMQRKRKQGVDPETRKRAKINEDDLLDGLPALEEFD